VHRASKMCDRPGGLRHLVLQAECHALRVALAPGRSGHSDWRILGGEHRYCLGVAAPWMPGANLAVKRPATSSATFVCCRQAW
jgi:hypothetical protein